VNVIDPFMDGKNIAFTARVTYKGRNIEVKYRGVAEGDTIRGTQEWKGGPQSGKYVWLAKRDAANVYGTWEISAGTPRANIDGVLNIKRVGNRLAASYFVKNEGREEGLRHIYVWGNSVYFRVPLFGRESEAIFTGTLENTGAKGKVTSEGWGAEYNWTGRRSK
jgi:hypothetical protein